MSYAKEINLIPYDVLIKKKQHERIWVWAVVILVVAIVLSGFYVQEKKKIGVVEGAVADLTSKKLEMERKLEQLNILNEKRNMLAKKERVINKLLHKRSLTLLFAELEKAMSSRVWLTSFDFTDELSSAISGQGRDKDKWVDTGYMIVKKGGPAARDNEQSSSPGVIAVLNGIAYSNKDVAGLLEHLSGSELFSEVNLMYLREETIDKQSVVDFKIETYLENMSGL